MTVHYHDDEVTVHHGDPVTLAYLAGVLDSDGFITIKRDEAPKCPGSFTHTEHIGVGQTSPAAVQIFADLFGGGIKVRTRKGFEERWQPIHYWVLHNRRAAECVAALRPYLRVKTAQADLLLGIRASKSLPMAQQRTVKVGIRGRALDPAIKAERDAAWLAIRDLNDRRHTRSQVLA